MRTSSGRFTGMTSSDGGRRNLTTANPPELFAYGTLILDPVIMTLLDRVPAHEVASAPGWRAAALPERVDPGLVADHHDAACGRVYRDLSPAEWIILDAFVDSAYGIDPVDLSNGRRALAFLWPGDTLTETWTPTSDLTSHELRNYLAHLLAWRARRKHDGSGMGSTKQLTDLAVRSHRLWRAEDDDAGASR